MSRTLDGGPIREVTRLRSARAALALVIMAGVTVFLIGPWRQQSASSSVTPGTVQTVAGAFDEENDSGVCSSGVATQAELYLPDAVAIHNGNVYFADQGDSCVYELDSSGQLHPIAGTGTSGYNGDNRPATSAQLDDPQGLAFDSAGDLFIADSQNERIREVSPAGIITTVAGNGIHGFSGDGGSAVDSELNLPLGIGVDSQGDLYISDTQNERVREVSTSGIITTIAGNGGFGYNGDEQPATSATLQTPSAIAIGPDGGVYVGDAGNNRVRKILDGVITTVAGDSEPGGFNPNVSVATETSLYNPYALSFDANGDLFIADTTACIIRELLPNGTLANVVGITPKTPAPYGTCAWNGDGKAGDKTELNRPYGMAVDASGNIFVADTYNDTVREYATTESPPTPTTTSTTSIKSPPPPPPPTTTSAGNGYWLVASDGGIFNFGDAGFFGSDGRHTTQQADRRHGVDDRRQGYWLVASRRRHLRLRRRRVLRLDGRASR